MDHESSDEDPTSKVNRQIQDLQKQVAANIQMETERGADLEGLNERTERLQEDTNLFEQKATTVKWKYFWKYFQWVIIAFIIIGLLVSMLFGGLLHN